MLAKIRMMTIIKSVSNKDVPGRKNTRCKSLETGMSWVFMGQRKSAEARQEEQKSQRTEVEVETTSNEQPCSPREEVGFYSDGEGRY